VAIEPDDSEYGGQTVTGAGWPHVNEDDLASAAQSFESMATHLRDVVIPAAQTQRMQLSDAWEGAGAQAALNEASAIISKHEANALAADATALELRNMEASVAKTKRMVNITAGEVQRECERLNTINLRGEVRATRLAEEIAAGLAENIETVSANTVELAGNLGVPPGTPGADGKMPTPVEEVPGNEKGGSPTQTTINRQPPPTATAAPNEKSGMSTQTAVYPQRPRAPTLASPNEKGGIPTQTDVNPLPSPAAQAPPESPAPVAAAGVGTPASPASGGVGGGGTTATSGGGGPSSAGSQSGSSSGTPSNTPVSPAASAGGPPGSDGAKATGAGGPSPLEAAARAPLSAASPPNTPLGAPAPASAPTPSAPSTPPPAAAAPPPGPSGGGAVPSGGGAAPPPPVGAAPGAGGPAAPPMPLGPPTTPPPAAPVPPAAAGLPGPGVAPASTSSSSAGAAPAPVPVSAARAERDAAVTAATAGALRRKTGGSDPAQLARHIGAALNAGSTSDFGFFWITGLMADGTIVVANNYGLGYIPEGVNLPNQVKMVSADESIPLAERARWVTYPILAVQGWAQHHNVELRAVVATEEQFDQFDPGTARITLQPEDIPQDGTMRGRSRLEVIAPAAAARLAAVSDTGLSELLPPAPVDANPPADESFTKWFEVTKTLFSSHTARGTAHLQAFVAYAEHAQELAVYQAHTATDGARQRAAIADWVYWQHLSVLMSDALSDATSS
jgi:hypothetical protein